MGARYYSPGTGRFTQVDPLGRSVYEANRYAYANCNPSNFTDPTGLEPNDCQMALASFAAGAITAAGVTIALTSGPVGAAIGMLIAITGLVAGTFISAYDLAKAFEADGTMEDRVKAVAGAITGPLAWLLPGHLGPIVDSAQIALDCYSGEGGNTY
jgi:uncharacterized protein RhaS with RHS repeats